MTKIEQLISEIEMYLDSCKPQAFSNNKKVVVEKDVIDEMLVELRMQTPEEIKKYQKIVANKDAIIADAQAKAESIIDDANKQKEIIVSEHAITQHAQAQAKAIVEEAQSNASSILNKAVDEANAVRDGAIAYTDNELMMMENLLTSTLNNNKARFEGFEKQLTDTLTVISNNRAQLKDATGAGAEEENKIDIPY